MRAVARAADRTGAAPAGWLQGTLLIVSTMTVMAGATIAPSLPAMARFFSDAPNAALWVRLILTLPALFTALGAPLAGVLIDRFGRRRLLVGAVALYGVAGAAGGLFSSLWLVLLTRALLGLSVGGLMTTVTTLIADYYDGAARSVVMGRQAAFMGFGGVLFLTAGGVLSDLSWRAPFLVYLLAFAWLPLVVRFIEEPEVPPAPSSGNGTAPPRVGIPWRIAGLLYAVGFIGMVVFYMVPVQIPFYLERLGVTSGARAGLAIAAATLVSALVSTRYGHIRARLGYRATFATVFALLAAGYGVIALADGYGGVIAGLVLSGLGLGLLMPNLNNWAGDAAPPAVRGRMLGGLTTCIFLGQFCSPILTQGVITRAGFAWGFGAAALFVALLAVPFAIAALRTRARRAASDA